MVAPEGGRGPEPLRSRLFSVDAALWWFLPPVRTPGCSEPSRAERTLAGAGLGPAGPEEGLFIQSSPQHSAHPPAVPGLLPFPFPRPFFSRTSFLIFLLELPFTFSW